MKRKIMFGMMAAGMALSAMGQTEEPRIFDVFQCHQMSGNGQWMVGRSNTYELAGTKVTETSLCNVLTGEIYGLGDLFSITPFSCPISSKGVAVLSTYDEATNGVEVPFMVVAGEEPVMLKQFYTTGKYAGRDCCPVAITDQATAFLGYYDAAPREYPFVCTINPDYTVGQPEYLPLPTVDIFGNEPMSVRCTCISDDGRTVAGIVGAVVPGTGEIGYPIVYTKSDSGEWTYTFPLAEIYEDIDPANVVDFYSPQIALSPDGTLMACTQEVPTLDDGYPDYVVWVIDIANGTYNKIESSNKDIIATGILDDGTVIGTFFATIKISYVYTPGAEDFVDFLEYAKAHNEEYGEWMEENLMVKALDYQDGQLVEVMLPNTGQIYCSDDLSTFGSGFQVANEYDEFYNLRLWSYVFTNFSTSGIGSPAVKVESSDVYNLNGVKVATLRDGADIRSLPAGYYIVNGKVVRASGR